MSTTVGKLRVMLTAHTKQFRAGMRSASKTTARFAGVLRGIGRRLLTFKTALLGALAGGGFAYLIRQQMATIDATTKMSRRLGIGVESLSELHHAAELSGVSVRTFNMGLQRMTRRMAEAANDTGEAKDAIKELGLDARRLSQSTPQEALYAVADALQNVESQSQRVRLAFKLFDSEGVAVLQMLEGGSKGLREFAEDARRLGVTITDKMASEVEAANDAMLRFKQAFSGLAMQATSQLAPFFKVFADDLTGNITNAASGVRGLQAEFGVLGAAILSSVDALQELNKVRLSVAAGVMDILAPEWVKSIPGVRLSDTAEEIKRGLKIQLAEAEGEKPWSSTYKERIRKAREDLKAEVDAQKGARDTAEKVTKMAKEAEAFAKAGEQFARSLRTPLEQYEDVLQDIKEWAEMGILNPAQYAAAIKKAEADYMGQLKQPSRAGRRIAGSAFGSQEAARLMQGTTANPQFQEQKRHTELLEEIRDRLEMPEPVDL